MSWAKNIAGAKPADPKVIRVPLTIDEGPPRPANWRELSDSQVKTDVRAAIADNKADDSIIESHQGAEVEPWLDESLDEDLMGEAEIDYADESSAFKLSQLIDNDFPFDESQLEAIEGLVEEEYGCLTGAAGTGKTTTTKKLVDRLMSTLSLLAVNMANYWKKADSKADADDEYEATQQWIPSIAMVSFTGRAVQQIKKNFPRDWHGNIMTIHRALGFFPEFYEEFDDESDEMRKKMRFTPTYNETLLMPWDVIIIDEAGMLGLDLWHQLLAACKPGCRIYMIGDINQLPPVHGRPIFGFALAKWPSWELTHVHRQQGKDNPIVDNAWRVLHGKMPVAEGKFQMIELKVKSGINGITDKPIFKPANVSQASQKLRGIVPALKDRGIYEPNRDAMIVPINGEVGSRGAELGQLPLNEQFSLIFNPQSTHPRFVIDGGRVRQRFAVGDKVMATKNDWEAGITNGMTGVISSIEEHHGYTGSREIFGRLDLINERMKDDYHDEDHVEFSMEDLESDFEAVDQGMKEKKEKRERGPSSHIVTVRFGGDDDSAFEIPFQSLSEVGSLMTAYVVTCHKMQGGEAPVICIVVHDSHRAFLYREWLYTAITRASQMVILFYTPDALKSTLNKQKIKGATLKEKVQAFLEWIDPKGVLGGGVQVKLPESKSQANRLMDRQAIVHTDASKLVTEAERTGGLAQMLAAKKTPEVQTRLKREQVSIDAIEATLNVKVRVTLTEAPGYAAQSQNVKDGGDLTAELPALPPSPTLKSQWGAVHMLKRLEAAAEIPLLTYQAPEPVVETPKPKNPWAAKLAGVK